MFLLKSVAMVLLSGACVAAWASSVQPVPVPPEMRSLDFVVKVNGKPVEVAHAAANYSYASFDITGKVTVEVTAAEPGFWLRGVDVEPWRLGIRPELSGQTIRFKLKGPAKLAISRPRDFLNRATMLFLFAGRPPAPPPQYPSVQVYPPGVYHMSLNPQSGQTLYLAPGSYFFGSLNLWNVHDVKVLGRGTIVYDGPQDPTQDQGWMQKPDWHCIGAMNASNIAVDGLTCIVRSRTWSIQMKDSHGFDYEDLRVMGGNPGNANQDGMDWIGSSDGLVRNSFFRTSDDVIALMGNWDGYTDEDMLRPGQNVENIVVEDSELSTSISNIVRAGWPQKIFNSNHFTLRNSDVLHAGIGACGQTFGLVGLWGAKGARGVHSDYTFENLWLDNWYSLAQLEQEQPELHGFTFRNIWALDQPPLAQSTIAGDVNDVRFENVTYGQQKVSALAQLPAVAATGDHPPEFAGPSGPRAKFAWSPQAADPKEMVEFEAVKQPHVRYTWLFGDGKEAHGWKVIHRYEDAAGTEWNGGATGAGRFRVLLKAVDREGRQDWAADGVVVVEHWHTVTQPEKATEPGLQWSLYPGAWTELPDLTRQTPILDGVSAGLEEDAHGVAKYATAWTGYLDVPRDGGYTFHLMARDGAQLAIDGVKVAATGTPFAQVCGSPGNAVRYDRGSIGLRAGLHRFHLETLRSVSDGATRVLWEGPGVSLEDIPEAQFSH
ncbi:MAG TPA: PA14 domain-containing protein [Terracidiphilus sp.]|nr:PA14 domain-containing protein [Terracidiphilus sp.]